MTRVPKTLSRIEPSLVAIWLLIGLYVAWFSGVTMRSHLLFLTNGFDLGIFDYAVWNNLHGNFFAATFIGEPSLLALHFQPILLPLALVYGLWPDARALLLVQSVVLGLGAWPIYRLGRQRLNRWAGVVFGLVYLLFPALQGANLFEFHPVTLAAGLLPFAYWYLRQGSFGLFLLFGLAAAACKQDVLLILSMMGFYLFVVRKDWRGLVVGTAAGLAFLLVVGLVIPGFSNRESHFALHRYQALGQSPGEMVTTLLTRPGFVWDYLWSEPNRVRYVTHLLIPVAYLSLLDPLTLLIALPTVAANLLADLPTMHVLDSFHYSAIVVPFVVTSAINGLAWLVQFLHQRRGFPLSFLTTLFLSLVLLASLLYHSQFGHTPLKPGFSLPQPQERHAVARQLLARIPAEAVISAQSGLSPHLTHRSGIYLFPRLSSERYGPAEYVALDLYGNVHPISLEQYQAQVEQLIAGGDYEPLLDEAGYLLLRRRARD